MPTQHEIWAFLCEQYEPASLDAIRAGVGGARTSVRQSLLRLVEQRSVMRLGEGRGVRYVALDREPPKTQPLPVDVARLRLAFVLGIAETGTTTQQLSERHNITTLSARLRLDRLEAAGIVRRISKGRQILWGRGPRWQECVDGGWRYAV